MFCRGLRTGFEDHDVHWNSLAWFQIILWSPWRPYTLNCQELHEILTVTSANFKWIHSTLDQSQLSLHWDSSRPVNWTRDRYLNEGTRRGGAGGGEEGHENLIVPTEDTSNHQEERWSIFDESRGDSIVNCETQEERRKRRDRIERTTRKGTFTSPQEKMNRHASPLSYKRVVAKTGFEFWI